MTCVQNEWSTGGREGKLVVALVLLSIAGRAAACGRKRLSVALSRNSSSGTHLWSPSAIQTSSIHRQPNDCRETAR
jgi:hypothetical protein